MLTSTKTEGELKLLELADMLENVPWYDQQKYYENPDCGSPSCGLGWWAHTHSDTWTHHLSVPVLKRRLSLHDHEIGDEMASAMVEFGLNEHDAVLLFGYNGCGCARTNNHGAAAYIRSFVEERVTARLAT